MHVCMCVCTLHGADQEVLLILMAGGPSLLNELRHFGCGLAPWISVLCWRRSDLIWNLLYISLEFFRWVAGHGPGKFGWKQCLLPLQIFDSLYLSTFYITQLFIVDKLLGSLHDSTDTLYIDFKNFLNLLGVILATQTWAWGSGAELYQVSDAQQPLGPRCGAFCHWKVVALPASHCQAGIS